VTETVVFSALLERDGYLPGLWNLHRDVEARDYWVRTLTGNLEHMVDSYTREATPRAKKLCRQAQAEYLKYLDDFKSSTDPERPRTVNALVEVRQEIFEKFGVPDPYKSSKDTENERALALLREVSPAPPSAGSALEGLRWAFSLVLAGNHFDMGSAEARRRHSGVSAAFLRSAAQLARKRWFRDDLEPLAAHLERGPRRNGSAVICVDNAGAEIVLGVPALAIVLTSIGFKCTIAANESPALNDMTASETAELIRVIGGMDPRVQSLIESDSLAVISSGSRTSGLDFTKVSDSFDQAASQAEITVVIGQGRAVETNWRARLAVPWARAAVVKDEFVARAVGCKVFDPLLTFETPS
jgi:uncharacterized protein with ATP-grasp and redox domains